MNKTASIDLSGSEIEYFPSKVVDSSTKYVDLSFNKIRKIRAKDLATYQNIKKLNLGSNKIVRFESCHQLKNLEQLFLHFNAIDIIDAKTFVGLKCLKILRLDGNLIGEIKLEVFASLSNLTYLDVSSNNLENLDFLAGLPSLKQLYCAHNNIRSIQNKLLHMKKLEELDISYNHLHSFDNATLTNLKVLKLSGNYFKDFDSFQKLDFVVQLQIDSNLILSISDIVDKFPNVESLLLHKNAIKDLDELQYLKMLGQLHELTIADNPVLIKCGSSREFLKELNLDFVDILCENVDKEISFSEEACKQLLQSRVCLEEIACDIAEKFHSFKGLLMKELPIETSVKDQNKNQNIVMTDDNISRPVSRCNSRAKIEAAQKFAKANYTKSS